MSYVTGKPSCATVSTVASQQERSWFKSGFRLAFVWSLPVWVLFGYSGFLPLSKDVHVRLTGGCDEMSAGVNVSLNDSLPVL